MTSAFQFWFHFVRNHLIKQMRSYSFLLVIGISLFVGYACVPAASDGYEVFYIGGVRGIYNSAWIGGVGAMLSSLLLWLFGFYMLRSQISEDARLKVGEIIASAPISKLRYISGKAISNLIVLMVMEWIIIVAFMAMQLLRGEDLQLLIWDYVAPFLFIVFPSLIILAALTVFFDVCPGLKGVVGNLAFFFLWVLFSVISVAAPNSTWDLFGLDTIRTDMVQEATIQYPFLAGSQEGGSFGYYPVEGDIPTFVWHGVEWDYRIVAMRVIWIAAAVMLICLSAWIFNRFKPRKGDLRSPLPIYRTKEVPAAGSEYKGSLALSPVVKERGVHLFRMVKSELRVMLKGLSLWWYLLGGGLISCSFFLPLNHVKGWLPILMVWPIAIWSQMGTREKHYFTQEMILSSCPPLYKWFAVWIAGMIAALLMSSGVIVHYALEAKWISVYSWSVGCFFIPTLAHVLGSMSGSRKLFEVIYMLWWYLGPINHIPYMDFLGDSANLAGIYLVLSFALLAVGLTGQLILSGHSPITRRLS